MLFHNDICENLQSLGLHLCVAIYLGTKSNKNVQKNNAKSFKSNSNLKLINFDCNNFKKKQILKSVSMLKAMTSSSISKAVHFLVSIKYLIVVSSMFALFVLSKLSLP